MEWVNIKDKEPKEKEINFSKCVNRFELMEIE